MNNRYGDVKYTQKDIERIIEYTVRRLEDFESCWDEFTRHMECGEIRDLKQSCIDDEIILSCLKKERYLESLIEAWKNLNEEMHDATEKLAANLPLISEFKDGNYILKYDSNIWDIETACKFLNVLNKLYPNSSFSLLPYGMDLVEKDS